MKTELESVNISVLNIGHASTKHTWGGRDLSSPFARLYYVRNGRATLYLPKGEVEMKPGYMYLIPQFMPHSYTCDPGFEFYYMFVYERYGEQIDLFDMYSFPLEVKANEAAELLFQNYCNLYPQLSFPYASAEDFYSHPAYRDYAVRYARMERYEKMQLQGLVWIVTSYFMKHASKSIKAMDERVHLVMKHVKNNIRKDFPLEELAAIACVTKAHLGRLFRDTLGTSPIQFVNRTKIQHAQRLLMTSNQSIAAISAEVGFADVSYFIRLFRRHIGFTPQAYRDKLRY